MTVGYFAPAPRARSGVSDYAAALLHYLGQFCEVRANRPGSINLYQIGNNHLHREIYDRALREPGAVLLHDAVLHHFLLGSLARDRYIEEFVYNYGEWHRGLAARLFDQCARSSVDVRYFRYAMLRRVTETARLVIVHNPAAESAVRAHAPEARIVRIPHLLFPSPAVRPERPFTFGVFGHLRETKRISTVLRVFSAVHRELPRTSLLLAGEATSSSYGRLIADGQEGVLRVGHKPESGLWTLMHSVEACINLRYPSAGETSGITIRLMEAGKPVIMTASGENTEFTDDVCIRIDAGNAEAAMLGDAMRWLALFPADAREMGTRAQAHVRRYHDPALVARQFRAALLAVVS